MGANDSGGGGVSRRQVLKVGGVVIGSGGAGAAMMAQVDESEAALNTISWNVSGDTASTDDGLITDVLVEDGSSDGTSGIELAWEGFESASQTIDLTIEVRPSGGTYETLATGSTSTSSTSGTKTLGWADVFGSNSYSLINNTSNISTSTFAADSSDGATNSTDIDVKLTASVSSLSISDSKTATVTFTVENLASDVEVGGTGNGTIQT